VSGRLISTTAVYTCTHADCILSTYVTWFVIVLTSDFQRHASPQECCLGKALVLWRADADQSIYAETPSALTACSDSQSSQSTPRLVLNLLWPSLNPAL
jgi:hypothetical protein